MKFRVCLHRFCLTTFVSLFVAQTYADCYSGNCGGSPVVWEQGSTSTTGSQFSCGASYPSGYVAGCGDSFASYNGVPNTNGYHAAVSGCSGASEVCGYGSTGCYSDAGYHAHNASGFCGYGTNCSAVASSASAINGCDASLNSIGSTTHCAGGTWSPSGIKTYGSGGSQCSSCEVQSSNVISSGDWSALPPIGSTTKSTHAQIEKPLTGTRVWTHRDGRKVNGILIAVGASHIRLVASGRMFTVPRHELSSKDEGILEGIPTDDQGRSRFSYLHLPGDSISRTWTDDRGRQFVGELVAMWGNNLMLQKRDRVYLVSPERLSITDRLLVVNALRAETRLAQLVR